jgi:group I intron endonuclease
METGIYKISAPSGKFYIGSTTVSFKRRWSGHKCEFRKNRHTNTHLQHAWNKYGEDRIVFSIHLRCAPEDCARLEQLAIDTLHPEYNIARDVIAPRRGFKNTPEHTEALRRANTGRIHAPKSEEVRRAISAAQMGRVTSEAARLKKLEAVVANRTPAWYSRQATKGTRQKYSPEVCERLSVIAKARVGWDSPRSRPVRCIETGMVFVSSRSALEWLCDEGLSVGTHAGNIGNVCRGKAKRAFGYTWEYAPKKPLKVKIRNGHKNRKPITEATRKLMRDAKLGKNAGGDNKAARAVRCVETGEVFATMRAAKEWLWVNGRPTAGISNICTCCTHPNKSAYGYHWKYADQPTVDNAHAPH